MSWVQVLQDAGLSQREADSVLILSATNQMRASLNGHDGIDQIIEFIDASAQIGGCLLDFRIVLWERPDIVNWGTF